jgi:hypothetical protein
MREHDLRDAVRLVDENWVTYLAAWEKYHG